MRAVIQRVISASVTVEGVEVSTIGAGLLVLLGVEVGDTGEDCNYIASKTVGLRIFADSYGKMNLDVREVAGEVLVVSQFTLLGDNRKGKRPSFMRAEQPGQGRVLYQECCETLRAAGVRVSTGEFGAEMKVELVNDGPVTILLDSRRLF